MLIRRSVVLLLSLVLSACASSSNPTSPIQRDGDIVFGTGTVRHFDLEGGFYAIVGDDNVTYDPENFASDFAGYQQPGLAVFFRARVKEQAAGFHQAGPIVELLQIREK